MEIKKCPCCGGRSTCYYATTGKIQGSDKKVYFTCLTD